MNVWNRYHVTVSTGKHAGDMRPGAVEVTARNCDGAKAEARRLLTDDHGWPIVRIVEAHLVPDPDPILADGENMADPFRGETPNEV